MEKAGLLVSALAVLLVGVLTASQLAAGVAPSPPTLCKMTEEDLTACRPAVTPPNPADPSAACCQGFAKADLPCLCDFKNNNPALMKSLGIDPDLAMQLPAKCGIPAPPKC